MCLMEQVVFFRSSSLNIPFGQRHAVLFESPLSLIEHASFFPASKDFFNNDAPFDLFESSPSCVGTLRARLLPMNTAGPVWHMIVFGYLVFALRLERYNMPYDIPNSKDMVQFSSFLFY